MKKNKFTVGDIAIYGILLLLALVILFPMVYIISISFSDPGAVSRGEVVLLPVDFSIDLNP